LKTCDSSQIVSFYGAFLDDGDTSIAICMEFCEAGSLEDIYKRAKDLGGVIGEPVLAKIAESVSKPVIQPTCPSPCRPDTNVPFFF
jgi:mitogen-activated protein kinase kinase